MQQKSQCFPLYWYEEVTSEVTYEDSGTLDDTLFDAETSQGVLELSSSAKTTGGKRWVRHDAITDTGLDVFRAAYPGLSISKESIFYYVYGILHSNDYRKRFASNLAKQLPRIPLARDFETFEKAGRKLARLHLNYEKVQPWPVREDGDSEHPGRTLKMSYPRKAVNPETGKKEDNLTVLKVAENLTIEGIPPRAYDYVVNGKTAIGWLVDRYRVATDAKSGIVNG